MKWSEIRDHLIRWQNWLNKGKCIVGLKIAQS